MSVKSIKITPRDFFTHLLLFGTLYASSVSFLALIFAYINVLFPDNLGYYRNYAAEIVTPSSVLMVIFPVFVFISWLMEKDLAQNPEKREMKFRKWLIYLTLFIAAVTIIVDVIGLVSGFYNGELTSHFIFKVLAVLFTALGVFSYYFLDLRKSSVLKPKLSAWIASAMVLTSLAGGFFIVGTPAQQRARRFDEKRVGDLQTIQGQLLNYWMQKEQLPVNLNELTHDQLVGFILPNDPETRLDYPYNQLTTFSFELCADFKTDSKNYSRLNNFSAYPIPRTAFSTKEQALDNWTHEKGKTCFERTIDPELYKKPNV